MKEKVLLTGIHLRAGISALAFSFALLSLFIPDLPLCSLSDKRLRERNRGVKKRGEGKREREDIFKFLSCRGKNTSSSTAIFVEVTFTVAELQVCQSVPTLRSASF